MHPEELPEQGFVYLILSDISKKRKYFLHLENKGPKRREKIDLAGNRTRMIRIGWTGDPKRNGGGQNMKPYNRRDAAAYAERWALGRNPAYYDFDGLGGDCTNFVSQCVYAGAGVMNWTPELGWYYAGLNRRAAAWTGVEFFSRFLLSNNGPGPRGRLAAENEMLPGDVIQLGNAAGSYYHSLLVLRREAGEILVAAHTNDALYRPLSSYYYDRARYLHITGVG